MQARSIRRGPSSSSLSAEPQGGPQTTLTEQMVELRRLRDEGQRLHEQGQHKASMEVLAKAEQMLVPGSRPP